MEIYTLETVPLYFRQLYCNNYIKNSGNSGNYKYREGKTKHAQTNE